MTLDYNYMESQASKMFFKSNVTFLKKVFDAHHKTLHKLSLNIPQQMLKVWCWARNTFLRKVEMKFASKNAIFSLFDTFNAYKIADLVSIIFLFVHYLQEYISNMC